MPIDYMEKIKNILEDLYNRFLILKYTLQRKHAVLIVFNKDFSKVDVISSSNDSSIDKFAEHIMGAIDVKHNTISI